MFVKYGFPLDKDRSKKILSDQTNHKSALLNPTHVDKYLKEEMAHDAIIGPFEKPPFPVHPFLPFLTREKSNCDQRHIIVDLSWPIGQSVNDASNSSSYEGLDFALSLPTIDHVVHAVKRFGKNCHIAKLDISRAFKQVPIDPRDIDLLGLHWGTYYIEKRLVFGYRLGSALYHRLSDSIRFIMTSGGHYCLDYINDWLLFGSKGKCQASFERLNDLLVELGLDISHHKTVTPRTKVVCLGILVDTTNFTLSIPEDKLKEIKNLIAQWQHKKIMFKIKIAVLTGFSPLHL